MYNGGKNRGWFCPKETNLDESAPLKWLLWTDESEIQMMNLAIDHVFLEAFWDFFGGIFAHAPCFLPTLAAGTDQSDKNLHNVNQPNSDRPPKLSQVHKSAKSADLKGDQYKMMPQLNLSYALNWPLSYRTLCLSSFGLPTLPPS